jgi:hypothetical protein
LRRETLVSKLLELADKVHSGQMSAATHVQKVCLKGITKVAGLADKATQKAPSAPARVAGPVRKVTGPVAGIVGTPGEFASYFNRATREWAELNLTFQSAAYDAVSGTAESSAEPKESSGASDDAPVMLKPTKVTPRAAASGKA